MSDARGILFGVFLAGTLALLTLNVIVEALDSADEERRSNESYEALLTEITAGIPVGASAEAAIALVEAKGFWARRAPGGQIRATLERFSSSDNFPPVTSSVVVIVELDAQSRVAAVRVDRVYAGP